MCHTHQERIGNSMKITQLIKELERTMAVAGDVDVATHGYFGTIVVEEVKITTWGDMGRYCDHEYTKPDQTPVVILLPANLP